MNESELTLTWAPRLLSVQVSGKTASSLNLLITGYATGRSLTQIDIQFTPVAGENVTTTKLSLPVGPSFTAWYQSAASQPFGSQFTLTLPLTLQGDLTNVTTLTAAIQSVSVKVRKSPRRVAPALFTTMSIAPCALSAASTDARLLAIVA